MVEIRKPVSLPFPKVSTYGVTAEEMKVLKPRVDVNPASAPMAEVGPTEFLNPSTSSEHLRLQVPNAADPLATPLGPLHDHLQIQAALARHESDLSQQIYSLIKEGKIDLPEARKAQILASLDRKGSMFEFMKEEPLEWQKQVYSKLKTVSFA
jgi:hypothetical protein